MKKLFFFSVVLLLVACRPHQPLQVIGSHIEALPVNASTAPEDQHYVAYLAPTKQAMEAEMRVQIGYSAERLWVGEPECPMLNWASDALWEEAKKAYDGQVDVAIVNMGGMRCEWPQGPITQGDVFELMPFDNRLVVLTLSGEDILDLCASFVRYGGQGVAGMRMTAVDGRLADVTIGGKAVRPQALYTVATSDYLAGGTDHMDALTRYKEYWKSDLLIRDLYMNAVQQQDTLRAVVDGRMNLL